MEKNKKKKDNGLKSERRVIFNSRTFNSKLFLKLTGHVIHPSIVCIQTLRYERENRKLEEIEKAIPWLKTFPDLMNLINLKETPESSHKLLIELGWSLFYQYYKKNILFKKAAEKGEYFSIVLRGKMLKLDIVFKREYLTLEEYLIYLFKMKLTREKEILKRCRLLNRFYADIDGDNLYKFCKDNPQFNYDKLKEIAKKEIYELGFKLEDFQEDNYIYSIDNFLKISEPKKNSKIINNILATPKFYIGSYQKVGYVIKGMAIGNLTPQLYIDNSTYISTDSCDIVYLNKKNSNTKKIYELMYEKKKKIFTEIKNSFFIFRNITEDCYLNEIIPFFEYKLYHKGDNLFLQDSLYEGIYLIKTGKINLYLNAPIIEISNYISNIKNSLRDFKEFVSSLKMFKSLLPLESESLKSDLEKSAFHIQRNTLYDIHRFDILTIPEFSIFGTNELYDYKTGLYYFSAECISKEAIIYFLPKKNFYSLLKRENPVYKAVAETVENKAKIIIEKLKLIIKSYEINNSKNKNLNNNNSDNKEDSKLKTLSVFNNYKNSTNNLRKNNNNTGLKLFTKADEKTYEFPLLLKEKYFNNFNKNFMDISKNDKKIDTHMKSFYNTREEFFKTINNNNYYENKMVKTVSHIPRIYINKNGNNIKKRNKTFEEKLFFNKTKCKFNRNIKLNLPSNFPFNVQNEFPSIIKKNKNYKIRNIFIRNK